MSGFNHISKIDHKKFKLESTYQQNLFLPVVCPRDQSLDFFYIYFT